MGWFCASLFSPVRDVDGGQQNLKAKLEMYRKNAGKLPAERKKQVNDSMQPIAQVAFLAAGSSSRLPLSRLQHWRKCSC